VNETTLTAALFRLLADTPPPAQFLVLGEAALVSRLQTQWVTLPSTAWPPPQAVADLAQAWREAAGQDVLVLAAELHPGPAWLPRLYAAAASAPEIGAVGPLSNDAGGQTIPQLDSPWRNRLPLDVTVAQFANRLASFAACHYPRLPLLDPDCLLLKASLCAALETPDLSLPDLRSQLQACLLRAVSQGWALAVADDAYVYRPPSSLPVAPPPPALWAKYETELTQALNTWRDSPVWQALRNRAQLLLTRWGLLSEGHYYWHDRRVLILLPLRESSGGSHVLISEGLAMRRMGVDVQLLNFCEHQADFESAYPGLEIPVNYVPNPDAVPAVARDFDAVIATVYYSVAWLLPLADEPHAPQLAYYIQDFEPYFFIDKAARWRKFWRSPWLRRRLAGYYFRRHPYFREAWLSYLRIPNMIFVTKTAWNQAEVQRQVGKSCTVLGPSYQIDRFVPRHEPSIQADAPLRITAMIRPLTVRRGATVTMQVLRDIHRHYGNKVEIHLFGCTEDDPQWLALVRDFRFQQHGLLSSPQVAELLANTDIFVDFSRFQAMGLTGLEAMACGAVVVLPQTGGADSFARHGHNAWLVDTNAKDACYAGLAALLNDPQARVWLRSNGLRDSLQYHPEGPAFRLLDRLFGHTLESRRD
jgi:O-antigen biosynthesis protein